MLNRYNEQKSLVACGMKNNGNTCYFNSFIQSLLLKRSIVFKTTHSSFDLLPSNIWSLY